jgi:hypothetical protein
MISTDIIQKTIFSLIIMTLCVVCNADLSAADAVQSDPDHISTGIEYRGTPDARIGDTFSLGKFSSGGMAEIRNEERFNQGALPNHNWRGFVFLYFNQPLINGGNRLDLTAGFEHESSHPTMGFNDGNDTAYDKIYDGTYRNTNMNSFLLRLSNTSGSGYALTFTGDAQFYFFSRNTPELPVNELTWSEGIAGGFEFRYPLSVNTDFFISGFDRYVFQSVKEVRGDIYYDTDSGVETRSEEYPIINNTNTVSARTGLIFNDLIYGRKVSVYCGILYGNIYGFTDSREKRTVYSIGIEIFH